MDIYSYFRNEAYLVGHYMHMENEAIVLTKDYGTQLNHQYQRFKYLRAKLSFYAAMGSLGLLEKKVHFK